MTIPKNTLTFHALITLNFSLQLTGGGKYCYGRRRKIIERASR